MDRKDYYFRQLLTEAELDAGFEDAEVADRALMADQALDGVFQGGEVGEQLAPTLSVDVAGPGLCYDQLGRRVYWMTEQAVDCSQDELTAPTAVITPGNAKVLTIFAEFDRTLSDERTDGNSAQVFFERSESVRFNVVQGAEAVAGLEVAPSLRADQLALADVTLIFGQASILNADIDSLTRRQDAFVLTGAPNNEREGTVRTILQAFQDQINDFINSGSSLIGYAGGGPWADGTLNPATNMEAQLDKIISDLATGTGSAKIRSDAAPAWKDATSRIAETLKARTDGIITDLAADTGAAKIGVPVSPAWADAATRAAEGLQSRVDGIISDLGSVNGGSKVGLPVAPTWHPSLGFARGSEAVQARADGTISDLASETVASNFGGCALIGVGASLGSFANPGSLALALEGLGDRVRGGFRDTRADFFSAYDSSSTPGGGGVAWAISSNGSRKRWRVTSAVTRSHSLYFALNAIPEGAVITKVYALGNSTDTNNFAFVLGLRSHRQDTSMVGTETIDSINTELKTDALFTGIGAILVPANIGPINHLLYQYFITCHVQDTDIQGTPGNTHDVYGIVVRYTLPQI